MDGTYQDSPPGTWKMYSAWSSLMSLKNSQTSKIKIIKAFKQRDNLQNQKNKLSGFKRNKISKKKKKKNTIQSKATLEQHFQKSQENKGHLAEKFTGRQRQMQRSKLILPKITFTCNNISGLPTPRLVLFQSICSLIHLYIGKNPLILKTEEEKGGREGGGWWPSARISNSVCVYPVPGKLRTLPPPSLSSFLSCHAVTDVLWPHHSPASHYRCGWPITFLHAHGGELWPLNPSVVSSPTITPAFLHPCLCSRSTHPHTKCLPCPSLGSRSSSPARTISIPVSNRWPFRTPSFRGNGFLF